MLDYKEFNDIDLKLHLQSGGSIKLGSLVIKPYTLREIRDFGYSNYISNLQLVSVSMDDFISSIVDDEQRKVFEDERTKLKVLDFFISFGGQELLGRLLQSLAMIFRTDDIRLFNDVIAIDFVKLGILKLDDDGELQFTPEVFNSLSEDEIKMIHRDNFDDIVKIVKYQNYLEKEFSSNEPDEFVDEKTRKLAEQMERHRKKVEARKKAQRQADENDDEIDIADIISAISSKSHSINKLNIWDFTLFQLYDEYSRLELIDNYDFSIKAIMAGAEKIDLKHWSSKL